MCHVRFNIHCRVSRPTRKQVGSAPRLESVQSPGIFFARKETWRKSKVGENLRPKISRRLLLRFSCKGHQNDRTGRAVSFHVSTAELELGVGVWALCAGQMTRLLRERVRGEDLSHMMGSYANGIPVSGYNFICFIGFEFNIDSTKKS